MARPKKRVNVAENRSHFSRQWRDSDVQQEHRQAAFKQATAFLTPPVLPFEVSGVRHDLEMHASLLLPRDLVVRTSDDLIPTLEKIRERYVGAVTLDDESTQYVETRAALEGLAVLSATLADALDALTYEQYYSLTSRRRHGGSHDDPGEGTKPLSHMLQYLGTETHPPKSASCQLSSYLSDLGVLARERATSLEKTTGQTNVSRNHMASPRWQLIHDCWSVCALLPHTKPSGTDEGRLHRFVMAVHSWAIGQAESGFAKDLKSYAPVRRQFDKCAAALATLLQNINTYARPEFYDFPDLRDRRSQLTRLKSRIGEATIALTNQLVDRYFLLKNQLEYGKRAAEIDLQAGLNPGAGIEARRRRLRTATD